MPSTLINYQLSSTLINIHQLSSILINLLPTFILVCLYFLVEKISDQYSFTTNNHHSNQLSSAIQLSSILINSDKLSSTLIDCHQFPSTVINHYQLLSTFILVCLLFMVQKISCLPVQKQISMSSSLNWIFQILYVCSLLFSIQFLHCFPAPFCYVELPTPRQLTSDKL